MTQGYVIHAVNAGDVDYETCARVLIKSLRAVGDTRPVHVISKYANNKVSSKTHGIYADDWQTYSCSPYDETFKLESDMIVTRSLDSWWELCKNRDLFIATGCRDYKHQLSTSRYYRRFNDENLLPDVYNGITYFKKSVIAKKFYTIVKNIFKNWKDINANLKYQSPLEHGDTDSVYAIAATIIGIEKCTVPNDIVQWVHMKQYINNTVSDDWTKELVWELINSDFRINTYSQMYPVHYHIKDLAKLLEPIYDEQV